ncbi:MAG: DEAD/DEAH box helicase [Alcaligenaceae bacterium]|nr:DEAD/DEAH box helicase [Alcaligenaceae bacterium]
MTFEQLNLHPHILKAVTKKGYTTPTPIQAQAIPSLLAGQDILAAAQTGTGKTAAFTLPILHQLMSQVTYSTSPAKHPVRALVLTPTRELAIQIEENVALYSQFTPIRHAVIYGGVDIKEQKSKLQQGVDLVIATPGRLLDHLSQGSIRLSDVQMLVLDEADRMLDMGFLPDLSLILGALPPQRQSLLFSATFSDDIRALARQFLNEHAVEIEMAPQNSVAECVSQTWYQVGIKEKHAAIVYLLSTHCLDQTIIFTNRKIDVNRIVTRLTQDGFSVKAIHGGRSQYERTQALADFKERKLRILVATDVAARGIDVAGLPFVINADIPYNPEDYVHRIGRTGRAGLEGAAINLMCEEETKFFEQIEGLLGESISVSRLNIPYEYKFRLYKHQEDALFNLPYFPEKTHKVALGQLPHTETIWDKTRSDRKICVLLGGEG